MPYDPDGDPNFDPNDIDAIDAMLDDPVHQALIEDLGNQFRALPPEEQIEDLATQMMKLTSMREELSARLDAEEAPPGDPRRTLLAAMNTQIEGFERRIAEVRDQPKG